MIGVDPGRLPPFHLTFQASSLDLAAGNVDHELGKLCGIAGTFFHFPTVSRMRPALVTLIAPNRSATYPSEISFLR